MPTNCRRQFVGGEVMAIAVVAELADDLATRGVDACTLNNALNVAQLAILIALLRWVHRSSTDAAGN